MTNRTREETPVAGSIRAWELLRETSSRRSLGWRRLAESFYYPTADWVNSLLAGDVGRDLRASISWLDSDREMFDPALDLLGRYVDSRATSKPASVQQDLEVEYSRLFIGPIREPPAQPYESVWMDRDPDSGRPIFGGPSMASVEQAYARHGLARTAEHTDMVDHIATEIELMCYLTDKEAAAWGAGDIEVAKELRSSEHAFLSEHLGRFAPEICDAVGKAASEDPYAAFAGFLLAFLAVESGTPYMEVVASIWSSPEPPPGAPPAA